MLEPRETRFWQAAIQLKLVDLKSLQECWNEIPEEKRTRDAADRRLARQVVAAGHMTLWQAQRILAGRQDGLLIGRYLLLDMIGQGGMGRVYLAKDTRLGREVAIKVLSRERMQNPRARTRFHREAKVGAKLQHENLIRVYDEGELGGMPYLVMEYIHGQNVAHMIADQGRLDPSEAAELGRQIALGLAHLHEKGLLHRDVNPANVLVDRDGTAKLTDLGLAIDQNDEEDVVTRDGATVGTFDYISPEQARSPRGIDARSDIYSLGCTLYHMIAGNVAFPATSLPEKLIAHQSQKPDALECAVPGLPTGLEAVIQKMMAKSPSERFEDAKDVARALQPYAIRSRPMGLAKEPMAATATGTSLWDSNPASATTGAREGRKASGMPGGVSPPARDSTSDPFDLFRIDLGAEVSLTGDGGATTTRSRSGENPPVTVDPVQRLSWPWIGSAVGVGTVLLALLMLATGPCSRRSPAPGPAPPEAGKILRYDPISVEFANGDVFAVESFEKAIRLAAGKPASVVLRGDEPLEITVESMIAVNDGLVIRAADGARPEIILRFAAGVPFLTVDGNSELELRGLHFRVELNEGTPAPPALLTVGGSLKLEDCSFSTSENGSPLAAVAFSGRLATLSGSMIRGFRPAIRATLFAGTSLTLRQCLLIGGAVDSSEAGWGLEITAAAAPLAPNQKRQVTLDHVTSVGIGLAHVMPGTSVNPLWFTVYESVVCSRSLLQWSDSAVPFPGGLVWSGRGNLYDLRGPAWVVADPKAAQAVINAPEGLEAWSQGSVLERETRTAPVRFLVEPAGTGGSPIDYRLQDIEGASPGAHPESVASPPETAL